MGKVLKLKDVCEINSGYAFKSTQYKSEGTPLIRIGDIFDRSICISDGSVYIDDDINKYDKFIIKKGDILIALSGATTGKFGIYNYDDIALLNQRVAKISPNELVYNNYVFHYMNKLKDIIYNKALGCAQPNISHAEIGELEIYIPNLETQKKIVEVLDKAQELIDKRKLQIKALDELIKSRFIEMFAKYESSYCTTIEEISDMVTVGIANSATHAYSDSGVIMFRNQNIKEGYLDDKDVIYITSEFADKYKTKALKENDLLVTRTGYPGVASLVPKKYEGCQTFTTLIVRLKELDSIRHKYVCNYINSIYGKRYVNEMKVGVAQQNFGAKALEKMPIFIPPIDEQIEFENFQEQVEKLKSQMETSLKELEDNFNSLMQKAFKGELF